MPPVKCVYYKCENTSEDKSMFRFPAKNENLLKIWLQNCGNKTIADLPAANLRARYLCSDHFDKCNVVNKTGCRKRLLKHSIPIPYTPDDAPQTTDDNINTSQEIISQDAPSEDTENVEDIDSQEEDTVSEQKQPLFLLLRRLTSKKQNLDMTNEQIFNILSNEFGVCIDTTHELEVDIYTNVIKKFLKDWPQWDDLESIKMSDLDKDAVTKVLNQKYKDLKEYLTVMLEAVKPLAKEAVKNNEVVMEIHCTRRQLNRLFFRRPSLHQDNNIFHISHIEPSNIKLMPLSYVDILNVWSLKISINLPHFLFVREIVYSLNHKLVNKVRNENPSPEELDTDLFFKPVRRPKTFEKMAIFNRLNLILQDYLENNKDIDSVLSPIFEVIRIDLVEALTNIIEVPGTYRRCANMYRYVRYLYSENTESDNPTYDLQLEETAAPCYQFYLGKLSNYEKTSKQIGEWLKIECMLCKIKFKIDVKLNNTLTSHIYKMHCDERDWKCTQCSKTFTLKFLAKNKWKHSC